MVTITHIMGTIITSNPLWRGVACCPFIPESLLFFAGFTRGVNSCPNSSSEPGQSVRAALNQSDLPGVPAAFQEVIDSGPILERMQAGTSSRWTNASPTTFFVRAHLHAGLAWISGIALTRLLPRDV
jgi:hypothetical protein